MMSDSAEFNLAEIPTALVAIRSIATLNQPVALSIDARHLACPLPLLKARQGLRSIELGEVIRVIATDAGSLKDFVSFAQLTGQKLEGFEMQDGVFYYLIRKQ